MKKTTPIDRMIELKSKEADEIVTNFAIQILTQLASPARVQLLRRAATTITALADAEAKACFEEECG